MLIIEPKVELWQQTDPIAHVAKCARVCYGNAVSKGEEADKRLYENLKKSGHLSMFRHESVYAIIPYDKDNNKILVESLLKMYVKCPYIQVKLDAKNLYVATNRNFLMDNPEDLLEEYKISAEQFISTVIGKSMMRYTFHITTQISTSRELNRVSPNNIAEKSTRYVREDGAICRPHWMADEMLGQYDSYVKGDAYALKDPMLRNYIHSTWDSFDYYKSLLTSGMKREDARGVLPLDTATEVVYTYSTSEWIDIIRKRVYHKTGKAHPNAVLICKMIEKQLNDLGYETIP